jgi:hypothetical protein
MGNTIYSNPSEAVQLAAIKQDVWAIYFIKNPSEKVKNYINSIKKQV